MTEHQTIAYSLTDKEDEVLKDYHLTTATFPQAFMETLKGWCAMQRYSPKRLKWNLNAWQDAPLSEMIDLFRDIKPQIDEYRETKRLVSVETEMWLMGVDEDVKAELMESFEQELEEKIQRDNNEWEQDEGAWLDDDGNEIEC